MEPKPKSDRRLLWDVLFIVVIVAFVSYKIGYGNGKRDMLMRVMDAVIYKQERSTPTIEPQEPRI